MSRQNGLFANNSWKPATGNAFQSVNPSNGKMIWHGNACTALEVNEAVHSAKQVFEEWAALTVDQRTIFLENFKKVIAAYQTELAELISKENGKPLWESRNEVQSMILKVGLSMEAYGQRSAGIMHDLPTAKSITRHHPHGVVGIIGPFNFPGHIPNGHIIPALLAGNTVVLKPSEFTPSVGEALAKYWLEADLPPGVFNVVQGGKETGQELVQHPDLQGLFFTGSYQTGRLISEQFGKYPEKILALELGGNNPLIVNEFTDPIAAIYTIIQSAYLSSGQRCTCARRLIVVKNLANEELIAQLIEQIRRIKVGIYTEKPEPFMGPLISENQALKLLETQKQLQSLGGISLLAMQQLAPETGLISPGLIDVSAITDLPDEENFGPLLQLIWVNDLKEAVKIANQTKYGLTAGLITSSEKDYHYFYSRIRAGVVNWNTQTTNASSAAPFGGIKCSGNHRPSAYYAADYCTYPVASMESPILKLPVHLTPGINL